MKASKSALTLGLLGLGASFVDATPTAGNLDQLAKGSVQIPKECPLSKMRDGEPHSSLEKRLLVNSLKDPVNGMRHNTANDNHPMLTIV